MKWRSKTCLQAVGLLALAMTASPAMAGNGVGNGGNVVLCQSSGAAELLDLYEGRVLSGLTIDPDLKGEDPYLLAGERLVLLGQLDPKSAKVYQAGLARLKQDLHLEKEITLEPLDDSAHVFKPKDPDCEVKRVAVLRKKPMTGEKRVLVDETIWKKMTPLQQAALLLHETIYERLANLGETDSNKARHLVSYVMSSKLKDQGADGYWKLIKELRLPIYR